MEDLLRQVSDSPHDLEVEERRQNKGQNSSSQTPNQSQAEFETRDANSHTP